MLSLIDNLLTTLVYLSSCFVLFYLGKMVYQAFHKQVKVGHELVEKDNFAFAVAHVGYFIGLLLAIGSAVIGESTGALYYLTNIDIENHIIHDLFEILIFGILAILFLNISIIINDKIILRRFSVHKEIVEDRNVGTGVIEGGNAVATGLIILGSISGDGGSLLTALVFWVVGQLLLIFTAWFYNVITPYDVHEYIEKDNVAVGIGFAGAMVAIANLIRHGLMHDFVSWDDSLITVAIDVSFGLAFLPVARFLTDKILLPGQKLTDEIINQEHPNNGAALIEAFAYIGGSVLITWSL